MTRRRFYWCSGGAIIRAGGHAISSLQARVLRDLHLAEAAHEPDPAHALALAAELDNAINTQARWRRAARGLASI